MSFILKSKSEIEHTDWGSLRWLSNPTVTSAKQLTNIEVVLKKDKGHNFHLHPNQEEVIYVVSGKVEQWLEKEKQILSAGDSIFIPKNVIHASFNIQEEPTILLVSLGPCADNEVGYVMEEVHEKEPWSSLRK